MKWDSFISTVAELSVFDLATVLQMTGQDRAQVRVQLHRWAKAGKVIRLRRGLYVLADRHRKRKLSPLHVANELYRPSYLSALWALSYYGLVPEAVPVYQSVSPRVTRRFVNPFGSFTYLSVKQDLFWGYATRIVDGESVVIADPEKAILDFWYLTPGEWTVERLAGMRFQQLESIDDERLATYVDRWASPRMTRAARRLDALLQAEREFERIP